MSKGIQETKIKVLVTLDDMSFSMSTTVARFSTSKASKAAHVRDIADHIADCIELPRKVRKT